MHETQQQQKEAGRFTKILAVGAAMGALALTACTGPNEAPQPVPTPGISVTETPYEHFTGPDLRDPAVRDRAEQILTSIDGSTPEQQEETLDAAQDEAEVLGVETPLGQAIVWDTLRQQGEGGDYDSLNGIIERTPGFVGTEAQYLSGFLDTREDTLRHPHDKGRHGDWPQSVDRVEALRSILASGNLALQAPVTWTIGGQTHTIER